MYFNRNDLHQRKSTKMSQDSRTVRRLSVCVRFVFLSSTRDNNHKTVTGYRQNFLTQIIVKRLPESICYFLSQTRVISCYRQRRLFSLMDNTDKFLSQIIIRNLSLRIYIRINSHNLLVIKLSQTMEIFCHTKETLLSQITVAKMLQTDYIYICNGQMI